jgi:hypothetical protein
LRPINLLVGTQEIEEEGAKPGPVESRGNKAVPRAVAAAPAAVGEDDHPAQDFGHREMSGETNRPHVHFDLLISNRGIVADARNSGRGSETLGRSLEESLHVGVRGGGEVLIPLAYGVKGLGSFEAHHLITDFSQFGKRGS